MRLQSTSFVPFLLAVANASQDGSTATAHVPACTATSSTGSGAFFDLRPDMAVEPVEGSHKSGVTKDYFAKGYDYGKNFTMNICGAVVDPVSDVIGVSPSLWQNVSAYYTSKGQVFSIGSESMELQSRGRKLVLQYTGGSPCGLDSTDKSKRDPQTDYDYDENKPDSNSNDPYPEDARPEESQSDTAVPEDDKVRRKSATISFLCDRDPGATVANVYFVGTDPDECAYFFEARSSHACAHAEPHSPGSVGPGSIFGLILIIAVLVYLLGGIFYNRTVAHARGWRQLPNFSLWAGIWSFLCDMFVIAVSACFRRVSSRRGYRQLNTSPSRRDRNMDAENRLIDQLDEEWED
ncbi:putative vacuolar sorting receptor [Dactylonectria macrodidyma]|uniref:Vacuolar sorting receptor n=1 Tax=Dactylonectria macrodidyma TaxID=307937 RepID=A0A9P9JKT9_9HYPO|nr:putative vacuolar sorting receptor [Dactylonectria macrodidyma]